MAIHGVMNHLARRVVGPAAGLLALTGAAFIATGTPALAASGSDWPAYLNGPWHSSYNAAQTAITPATASTLVQKWHDAAGHAYFSSPVVADGAVFIGADSGWFYKFNPTTGATEARVYIGVQRKKTCTGYGFTDTAAVAPDPVNHQQTVYVGAANGYLYALRASNLSVKWKSEIAVPSTKTSNYYEWSSPTVAAGEIYIGVSSNCDHPLIRGGVIGYNRATGKKLAEFYTVPKGDIGGSVWSSVAVAPGGDVYVTTGNGPENDQLLGYSESILKLSPKLKLLDRFQIPKSQVTHDADFGASPTLFGPYVGACDKNGIFYALKQSTMTLAWEQQVDAGFCIAAAVWNGQDLYLGTTSITINGTAYGGSIQERSPASGTLLWETGVPDGVFGSPTMDGGGVIAAGTYGPSTTAAIYLVSAATGQIVQTLALGADNFGQSVFANGWLYMANADGVYGWGT
jgi:outer membrane protein assembly factor BamB